MFRYYTLANVRRACGYYICIDYLTAYFKQYMINKTLYVTANVCSGEGCPSSRVCYVVMAYRGLQCIAHNFVRGGVVLSWCQVEIVSA